MFKSNLTKKFIASGFPAITITLVATAFVLLIRQLGWWQILELAAYDRLVNLSSNETVNQHIVVVEITESDIKNQQRWPISDQTIAQLIKSLQPYQPKVIGLDLYRDISYLPGTEELKVQLQSDNVITIEKIGAEDGVDAPAGVPKERIGFNDLVVDPDNVIRRQLVYAQLGSEKLYSFSLRLVLAYLSGSFEVSDDGFMISHLPEGSGNVNRSFNVIDKDFGGYQLPASETAGWQIMLNYQPTTQIPKVSLSKVLAGNIEPNLIQNKIVLIGTSAPSIKDLFITPYSQFRPTEYQTSGVMIHAMMVNNLLGNVLGTQPQIWSWTEAQEWVWIALWAYGGVYVAWRSQRLVLLSIFILLGLSLIWLSGWLSWLIGGWIPVVPTAIAFAVSGLTVLGFRFVRITYYDSLTSLPNRRLLDYRLRRLYRVQSDDEIIAVLYLDLDNFKLINDGLGYITGNRLLVKVAERLVLLLPTKASIARVGGDKFAIAIGSLKDIEQILDLARLIQQHLTLPYELEGYSAHTSVSVGIAHSRKNLKNNLLRNAEIAMYRAKAKGKARCEVFAQTMYAEAAERIALETDLRSALTNREFLLQYQPIIDFSNNEIIGFEALVRWNSPQRGMVSPGKFIPVAEETGLIIPLGYWVLETACQHLRQWQQVYPQPLSLSINLSSRQFSQPDLVEQIERILHQAQINSDCIKLEITESMIMENVETAISMMKRIKKLGLRLSIDDFGTGFSSFSYLHRFPMDTLKIDRSFVNLMDQNSKNVEIISSIIVLGHKLGMNIVAEGVETKEQMLRLREMNCDCGQGYLFSKPVPEEVAASMLKQQY